MRIIAARRSAARLACLLAIVFSVPGMPFAAEAGALALPPGESHPPPRQRGMNDIEAMPTVEMTCPVCGFAVAVPQVDKLMRRPAGLEEPPPWRMHFESRDQDFCPYPAKDKIAHQADIVVCPSCGYAAPADIFAAPVPEGTAEWVRSVLTPNLFATLRDMLGRRGLEMSDAEVSEFYNRQEEIPDAVRLEHERLRLAAIDAPRLERARIAWLAAWAARREVASAPRSVFLARRAANVAAALKEVKRQEPDVSGDIAAIRHLLARNRSGKDRLSGPDRYAARALLAGLLVRRGESRAAEETLIALYQEFRERFLRPDQDPLWSATSSRHARTARLNELELFRRESEREILVRLELLRREREYLREALDHIVEAIPAGELAGKPEEALYIAYLAGEFHRRLDNLPLAAEWFRHVRAFAPDSPWAKLAERQLALVREAAGDRVNLLSGLGQEAELFDTLRGVFVSE